MMTDIEKLQEEINRLQKTVSDLQSGIVKYENPQLKLKRIRSERFRDVFKFHFNVNDNRYTYYHQGEAVRKSIATIINVIVKMKYTSDSNANIGTICDINKAYDLYDELFKQCCIDVNALFDKIG